MDQSIHASTALQPGFEPGTPAVAGPFVVNLCASVAPIDLKSGNLPGLERYRLYQVRRVEDNRPRYRLRLGFFANESAAEVVLAAVREFYPASFCVPAGSDDLKHAPGFDPVTLGLSKKETDSHDTTATSRMRRLEPAAAPAKPVAATPAVAVTTASRPASPAPAPAPQPQAASRIAAAKPVSRLELLPETPPRSPEAQAAATSAEPFRVKAADPSLVTKAAHLELDGELPDSIRKLSNVTAPLNADGPVLIDSTQTLRILTETELADSDAPAWFAVQVAVSEQAINLDAMPKLDIFKAFRLYSIAQTRQGAIEYSLRLGFFRESVSAEAVTGYLKTFFGEPRVLRVSAAEQARFAEPPAPPVLNDAAGKSARVVQLRPDKPAAKPATAPVLTKTPAPKAAAPAARKPVAAPAAKPVKQAAANAVARKSGPAVTKQPAAKSRSLNELLVDEAREVALSESGVRRVDAKGSLLSRLVGKLTR